MKRNHRFILGASDDIDRRTLQYLLDPPRLWEPEPPQTDGSHVTVYFPNGSAMSRSSLAIQRHLKEEKISWNIAGEDTESLCKILLEKSDYLISGILVETEGETLGGLTNSGIYAHMPTGWREP